MPPSQRQRHQAPGGQAEGGHGHDGRGEAEDDHADLSGADRAQGLHGREVIILYLLKLFIYSIIFCGILNVPVFEQIVFLLKKNSSRILSIGIA